MIELLVVMVVMLAVLTPLVHSFVSAETAQVDQTRRFDAQENARLALDRMRKDIHCAHGVTDPYVNASGGMTVVLTETNTTGQAECPGIVQTNASAVQWCTIPVAGAINRFRLYRENDPSNNCDGSASTFMVDYLIRTDPWASPTCVSGQYADGGSDVCRSTSTRRTTGRARTPLGDEIALRNGDLCS